MRTVMGLLLASATSVSIALAPPASAEQTCTNVGGGSGTATLCQSPGNAQLNASPPDTGPVYPYPWDDEYWGPALVIGGNNNGGGWHPGHR
ncbi:MAG: hypothetical protein WCE30_11695 [Mycobacterium sp.]